MNPEPPATRDRVRIRVRNARLDDLDTIVAYNAALALETEGKALDRATLTHGVRAALDDPDRLRYWVAESVENDRVLGQAAVTREWTDWRNGWLWWFQSVYVHPEARSQGIFRALHAEIRSAARALHNVVGLRLYVEAHNQRAQRTYQALGLSPGGYLVFEELWPERFGNANNEARGSVTEPSNSALTHFPPSV